MEHLTRDLILARLTQRAERDYPAPPLGGAVRLREPSRAQLQRAYDAVGEHATVGQINMLWFAISVVDPESKEPLFSYDELAALADDGNYQWDYFISDVADAARSLSEVGSDSLKSVDLSPDT